MTAAASNVEIKARAHDFERQARLAREAATAGPELLVQEDVFFRVPTGRLKLRQFADGSGELIQYVRENHSEPTESRYVRVAATDPPALREALANALGELGTVRKRRTLYLAGRTRIHLDQVEGLGDFLELEVVLEVGESTADGVAVASELMQRLEIRERDLVQPAYIDLLLGEAASELP